MNAIAAAVAGAAIATLLGGPVAYLLGLRRSRYERLEEKQAEVIAELSRLLFEVDEKHFHWYRQTAAESLKEKGQIAAESLEILIRYFHSNVVWLDSGTAARVENTVEELRDMGSRYYADLITIDFQMPAEGNELARNSLDKVRAMREDIIKEFREILYPQEWWTRIFPWRVRLKRRREESRSDSEGI